MLGYFPPTLTFLECNEINSKDSKRELQNNAITEQKALSKQSSNSLLMAILLGPIAPSTAIIIIFAIYMEN